MAINVIRKFLMKKLMKPDASGIMKIPEKGRIDFTEHFLKERLFTNGIDHKLIKNEKQLENILHTIDKTEANKLKQEADKLGLNDPSKNKFMKEGEVIKVDFGNWPEKKAQGGRTGSGLNYLLGEDDQNSRVPYASGSRKKSWTDRIAGWTGGKNIMAAEGGLETWELLNNLLQSGGLYAEGGRVPFKKGHSAGRRKFLKLAAGLATIPIVGKYFKWAKPLAKTAKVADLTSVPINNISGMPDWFKPLVNKVIKEGEDITKTMSTKEREIVHHTNLPHSDTDVIVTQNLDSGNVSVDIGIAKHDFKAGHLGQPARLNYKASEWIEPTINTKTKKVIHKGQKTKPEFNVEEAEFTGGHPENIKFEESTIEKFGEHGSDFSEVEKFATGKVTKSSKGTKQVWEADWDDSLPDYEDFASGGRVPFIFGGGAIKNVFKRLKDLRKMPRTEKMMKPNPKVQHLFTEADKLELSALKLEHAEAMLDMLKSDRQLFLQFQSNRAMKDEGLDFLMKKMLEPMAPHIKGYKSLKEIDEAILNMEMIVKNKTLKQGRQLNASGGLAHMLGE